MLIVLTLALLVALGFCVYKYRTDKFDKDGWRGCGFFVLAVYGIIWVFGGLHHLAIKGKVAELNEMRRMVRESDGSTQMEDVYGEAAKLNLLLARAKRYNQMFALDPWWPDEYAGMDPIALPVVAPK